MCFNFIYQIYFLLQNVSWSQNDFNGIKSLEWLIFYDKQIKVYTCENIVLHIIGSIFDSI